MWTKLKITRDAFILAVAVTWGTYEILHDARLPVLVLVGTMLGLPIATRADEILNKIGQKRDDSDADK